MALDPHLASLLKMLAANPKPVYRGSLAEARGGYRALAFDALQPTQFAPVGRVEDLMVDGHDGLLRARVYRPDAAGPTPTIAFFHGGGFVLGDLDTHDNMCRELCRGAVATVVAVDYRLAPEHRYPAAAEDALAATRWIVAHRASLGGTDGVAVAGDSAGGNLAAGVAQALHADGVGLAGQFLVYPTVDRAHAGYPSYTENGEGYFLDIPTMEWFTAQYLGEAPTADLTDPRLSPLQARSLAGLPRALIVTAQFDPLRDEGAAYAQALEAAGVEAELMACPGMIHGFFSKGHFSPGAQRYITDGTQRFGAMLRRA